MRRFLKEKSLRDYIIALAGLLAIIIIIGYSIFTLPYGIFNENVLIGLVLVVASEVILIIFDTKYDSYIQIFSVVCATLALSFFLTDCVGTINDYINDVVFMGSGAPISGIVKVAVTMFAIIIMNILSCFFKKTKWINA